MKNPFLVGKRIYLRPHEKDDLDSWFAWFNDPDVTRFLEKGYFPNTRKMQAERLKGLYTSASLQLQLQLAVVDQRSKALVGTVGLHQINLFNRNADVSIVVGNRKFWGKGYGAEAVRLVLEHGFGRLNLHKITAGMVESNRASYKLFENLGFRKEGVFKQHLHIQGRLQSMIKMALFRPQWSKAGEK